MLTVGLGLLGASVVVLAFQDEAPDVLEGFGFGAALLAMFMRVGGGIFTKAADVGADLVGKVEQNIPEDDPRNAATIADNVGDNVGDCAGMAADLFESYAVTLVAALILGSQAFGDKGLVFPLLVPAIGALSAVAGVYLMKPRPGENGLTTINRAFYLSAAVGAVGQRDRWRSSTCPASGASSADRRFDGLFSLARAPASPRVLAVGRGRHRHRARRRDPGAHRLLHRHRPQPGQGRRPRPPSPARRPSSCPASSVGFESAVYTAIVIGAAVFGAALLAGGSTGLALFAVALAGCGLLTTVGVIVAMDTFGPVSDNAQGIAEMSGDVSPEGAQILTELDAVGNTTKAITKGIAIATAVLAASALFASYTQSAFEELSSAAGVTDEEARFGSASWSSTPSCSSARCSAPAVVFLFSGLAINAVGRAAGAVVFEVRRQFREIPGIMEGTGRPEYGKVVDIVTSDSLRELATPGILAILAPVAVGFGLGVGPLAGFLAGAIATGTLMAVFLANSGGAWDNAKKLVEDGHHGGKGSSAHEATIIGDTVGDPFKDTAGPAINPLLKVMNLVSLLIVGAIVRLSYGEDENDVAADPDRAGRRRRASRSRSTSPSSASAVIGDDEPGRPAGGSGDRPGHHRLTQLRTSTRPTSSGGSTAFPGSAGRRHDLRGNRRHDLGRPDSSHEHRDQQVRRHPPRGDVAGRVLVGRRHPHQHRRQPGRGAARPAAQRPPRGRHQRAGRGGVPGGLWRGHRRAADAPDERRPLHDAARPEDPAAPRHGPAHRAASVTASASAATPGDVGLRIREWRERRRLSQLELSNRAEVSTRHLSFVETGRSRPTAEMIERLAGHLDVPLRERNRLLLAGGFAPAHPEHALDEPDLAAVRDALRVVLVAHEPHPAVLLNRCWELVEANAAVAALLEGVDPALLEPPVNVLRLSLHPRGLAPRIVNLGQWRGHLLAQLRQRIERTADPRLVELADELAGYPGEAAAPASPTDVVLPLRLSSPAGELSFFSIAAHVGTAADVTLEELTIEAFYPADAATAAALRAPRP